MPKGIYKRTESQKSKLQLRMIGNKLCMGRENSEKQKSTARDRMLGNKFCVGKKLSDEHKLKISMANIGKKPTESIRKLLSEKAKQRCTKEWKENLSKKLRGRDIYWARGESHYLYKKDRAKLAKYSNGNEYRNSSLHREWSQLVKNRDGWKCKISNNNCFGKVVAHHILPWSKFPELRYEVNNGITLCHFHHPRKRNDEMRLAPIFQELVVTN